MPTIGVAVSVPKPWGSRLQDHRTAAGDLSAEMIPTHITLVPPTVVEQDLGAIEQHLAAIAAGCSPFDVHLRGTGTFRPVSPVVFVALVEGISQCEALAQAVRSGPLDVDLDFPYHPHVTVAHHLDDAALDAVFADLADFECRFEVKGFHLYVHDPGVGWQPTSSYLLAPATTPEGD